MLKRTHLVFALLLFMILVFNLNLSPINKLMFLVIFILAAIIPDIDTTESSVGRKTKPASNLINVLFGHRGFFHSLTFIIILAILLFILKTPNLIAIAILTGYVSHLILDAFTKTGIRVFWPLKSQAKGSIKTGSTTESIIFLVFLAGIIALFFKNFSKAKMLVLELVKTIF